MNIKKFKLITILGNLTVIFVFSWMFICDPIESTTGVLLIFVTLSMANLYFIVKDDDFKKDWFKFWQKRK